MTALEFKERESALYAEMEDVRQKLKDLKTQSEADQEKCAHPGLEPASMFGEKCQECGKFWPGAF